VHDNDVVSGVVGGREYVKEVAVNAEPLDCLLADVERVDFLFVTVNGAELEVLRGAEEVIQRFRPRMWVKAHALTEEGEPLSREVVQFLQKRGYRTLVTLPSKSPAQDLDPAWRERQGDVYAW
jgi:hypothetical protein